MSNLLIWLNTPKDGDPEAREILFLVRTQESESRQRNSNFIVNDASFLTQLEIGENSEKFFASMQWNF